MVKQNRRHLPFERVLPSNCRQTLLGFYKMENQKREIGKLKARIENDKSILICKNEYFGRARKH